MSDNLGHKVLVIGGGKWQAPLIEKLRSYFLEVDAVDPYTDSAGISLVDHHISLDIKEIEPIYSAIKERNYELIISDQSDLGIETVTLLSERLGLPGNAYRSVELFLKKNKSRDFASALGIAVPQYIYSDGNSELEKFYLEKNFKVIVKPSDSQASRGVSLVNAEDLNAFRKAVEAARLNSRNRVVMVEEFISGTELTAEGLIVDGRHTTLTVSEKEHFRTGIASRLKYPADLPEAIYQKLFDMNDLYVNQSGIRTAITHAEYIFNADRNELVLIEIACRGGGSLISSSIIPWMSGIDVYDLLIRNHMGEKIPEIEAKRNTRHALLQFFEFSNGRIEEIAGLNEIKGLEGVTEFIVFVKTGEVIEPAGDDSKRHAMVVILADHDAHLQETLTLVNGKLKVTVSRN